MEFLPYVPILDGSMSLPGGALVDFLKGISLLSVAPTRSLRRAPQKEELVEVPTPPCSAAMSVIAGHVQGPHQRYCRRLLQGFLQDNDDRDDAADAQGRPRTQGRVAGPGGGGGGRGRGGGD